MLRKFYSALLAVSFVCGVRVSSAEEDGPDAKLRAFAEKLPRVAPSENGTPNRFDFASQLRVMAAQVTRGNYDRLRESLGRLPVDALTPELQVEWSTLQSVLLEQLAQRKARAIEEWQVKVDRLVSDARATCLAAKTAGEVEPLLVRAVGLQMEREPDNNALVQRITRKLAGVVRLATDWTYYLDYVETGNTDAARQMLTGLLNNNGEHYPVLASSDINARLATSDPLSTEATSHALENLRSPEDLPKVVEELKANAARSPRKGNEMPRDNIQDFATLLTLSEAAKKGDSSVVARWPDGLAGSFTLQSQTLWNEIRDEIATTFIAQALKTHTDLLPNAKESASSYSERVMAQLFEKQKYDAIIEVYRLRQSLKLAPARGENWDLDRAQLEAFVAARRFEAVGDALSAITSYRMVVGGPAGKYLPMNVATEALKHLRETNPAAFSDYQGAVLDELRLLRSQFQQLSRPGMPFFRR